MATLKSAARLAVDVGGTFTDVVLDLGAKRHATKVLTTPDAPEQAIMEGTRDVLGQAKIGFADLDVVVHGTTLATNAIIERKGARTALIGHNRYEHPRYRVRKRISEYLEVLRGLRSSFSGLAQAVSAASRTVIQCGD